MSGSIGILFESMGITNPYIVIPIIIIILGIITWNINSGLHK